MTVEMEQIELSIAHAEAAIAKRDCVDRLTNNKDFKEVILDGYFKDEASRLVLLKADPSLQGEVEQKSIDNQINAIGYVRQYFNTVLQLGNMASNSIEEDRNTRNELAEEEL